MKGSYVPYSKGQIKIQQMAFVLVAFVLFFGLVALFYFSFTLSSLREDASEIRDQQARETVKKLTATPEFSWTADSCASCIDMDKVLALKNRTAYRGFWGDKVALLEIKKIYPTMRNEVECNNGNYPDCNVITIVKTEKDYTSQEAFAALCRFEQGKSKCEMGKIILAMESP